MYSLLKDLLKRHQFFWDVLGLTGKWIPVSFFGGVPSVLKIEATNICQLSCPVCPTHLNMIRKRGYMKREVFENIINSFKGKKKPTITFSMSGEPLLNRELPYFIRYATGRGFDTNISSNGVLLGVKYSEDLIESGLNSIHLSLDGMTRLSHEAYRVGSHFDEIRCNIENFINIKNKLNSTVPRVIIQTLLTSYSENDLNDIIQWARDAGADKVVFKSLSLGSHTNNEIKKKYQYLLPGKSEYLRKKSSLKKTICLRPVKEAVVYWDGVSGLCCVDFNNFLGLSVIDDGNLSEALNSKKMKRIRKKGFLKQYHLCSDCSLGNSDYGGFEVNFM